MTGRLSLPRSLVLRWLRIPPEPEPPSGSPGSLRQFRAGRNYFRLKRWGWGFRQASVLIAIAVSVFFLHRFLQMGIRPLPWEIDLRSVEGWIAIAEGVGLVFALIQMPFTYAVVVLDFEQRWYMVTDRSLRIREGLGVVREMTVSLANIQNVSLQQGPLQRLLGLHDLVVTTAGGGESHGAGTGAGGAGGSYHRGVLRGVDNAEEIRDLILARLRRLRDAGLGDPDEAASEPDAAPPGDPGDAGDPALAAARALRDEARALRVALGRRSVGPEAG